MLRNPFYVGEVRYKNEILPGPQPPLLDRVLFDAVQAKLTAQRSHRTTTRLKTQALLAGLLFDDAGQPMVSTHATKNRVRYRYYVSAPCLRGPADDTVGSVRRVPAKDIELAVAKALIVEVNSEVQTSDPSSITRELLERMVGKVEVRASELVIHLKAAGSEAPGSPTSELDDEAPLPPEAKVLIVP